MSAKDFRAWQAYMGWSNTEAARRLQVTRYSIQTYRTNGARLYIALAAVALAHGLAPWATRAHAQMSATAP